MPPAALDQISSAIGRLQGEMEESHRQRALLAETLGENTAAVRDLTATVKRIECDLKPVKAAQADIERWKNRGLGVFAGVVLVGTLIGNAAIAALGKIGTAIFGGLP